MIIYKAISIIQPWASLTLTTDENKKALKRIETRSWNTKHRGMLFIHASSKKIKLEAGMFDLVDHMERTGFMENYSELPYMAIIGMVNLDWIIPTSNINVSDDLYQQSMLTNSDNSKFTGNIATISKQEYSFGDYSPNRFGWVFSDPILFKEPIPCKGQLSIWNVPKELHRAVNHQIQLS